jgi:hypothetical protein
LVSIGREIKIKRAEKGDKSFRSILVIFEKKIETNKN